MKECHAMTDEQLARGILLQGPEELRSLPDAIAKEILEKKPTPAQAQAVLIQAWESLKKNSVLTVKSQRSREK